MLDPGGLLAVARLLLDETAAPVTDAQLRRAASTAYYALFHTILRAAAERFVGQSEELSAAYGLIYRSFDHGRMTDVCLKLRASSLSTAMKRQLRRDAVSQDMRDFASAFPDIQEQRHLADYDPAAVFNQTDVHTLLEIVGSAIASFSRTSDEERAAVLALMLGRPRG